MSFEPLQKKYDRTTLPIGNFAKPNTQTKKLSQVLFATTPKYQVGGTHGLSCPDSKSKGYLGVEKFYTQKSLANYIFCQQLTYYRRFSEPVKQMDTRILSVLAGQKFTIQYAFMLCILTSLGIYIIKETK